MFPSINSFETPINNACAWSLMDGPSSKMLVMVYSDEESGEARVSCFSDSGMRKMRAEEFGFDHSLLTDIDRITDEQLVKRLGVSPIGRDSEWNPGPWSDTIAGDIGVKFKRKPTND